jgi:hypothetical protein
MTFHLKRLILRFVSEPDGLVEILQRALNVAFGAPRNAPVVEGVGIVRLEPNGLIVILQRALKIPFGTARIGTVVEGVGKVRLEPDSLIVILQCSL